MENEEKIYKEIEELKSKIEEGKRKNKNNNSIKNLKVNAKRFQRVMPYALTAGVIAGAFSFAGHTPIYLDGKKTFSDVKSEIDSNGNVRYEQQFGDYENRENRLYYYSKWEKQEDGTYTREKKVYPISEKYLVKAMTMIEEKNVEIEDVFGKPITSNVETAINISEQELAEGEYIKAVVYNHDENSYIVKKQSIYQNTRDTILYLIITLLIVLFEVGLSPRYQESISWDIVFILEKAKEKEINISELEKLLEIKEKLLKSSLPNSGRK